MTDTDAGQSDHIPTTAEIVAAYVGRNSIPMADLPGLIQSVFSSLAGLGKPQQEQAPPEPLKPAVPVRKSITDEYLVSLEDGRKLKSMKKYLAGLGMTPADYRKKWGLPSDYPMVAPSYARQRSELARTLGLGRKSAAAALETAPEPQPEPKAAAPAPAPKRGRKKAA